MSPCSLGGVTALLLHLQPHTCTVPHLTVIKYLLGFSVQAWTGPGTEEGPRATALSRHAGNTHRESRQTGVWAAGALNIANIWGWQGLGKVTRAHCSLGCALGGDQEGGYRMCREGLPSPRCIGSVVTSPSQTLTLLSPSIRIMRILWLHWALSDNPGSPISRSFTLITSVKSLLSRRVPY